MTGIIIHINGWPGSGKYTVGRIAARRLNARLVPNHSLCAPGFCVADFGTTDYIKVVRQVRSIVYRQMIEAPSDGRFILTAVLSNRESDLAHFEKIKELALQRDSPLLAVTLVCDLNDNLERIDTPAREHRNSLTDPKLLRTLRDEHSLLQNPHDPCLELNTSQMEPEKSADQIVALAKVLSLDHQRNRH